MTALAVLASLVLAAAAPAPSATQQVLDTEKAFVQLAAQVGVAPAFRQFAAPEAVMFLPDPVPAAGALGQAHWPGELSWRVQYVGAAGSGDLAFSAGPSLLKGPGLRAGGFYLAIWKRQPDGGWKFVVDRGAEAPPAVFAAAAQPTIVMNTDSAAGAPSGEGIREADGSLNVALPRGAEAAFAARLDDQAVMARTGRAPAAGKRKAMALVADSPPILEALTLGGGRSQDGTLGYTYGRARSAGAQAAQLGYYVRVWRSTPQGWRLLVDHLAVR